MQVEARKTPLSLAEQAQYLAGAMGAPVNRRAAELLLAHLGLENDRGRALWNNNPGNLTTTKNGQYYTLDGLSVNAIGERIAQDDPDRVTLFFWDFATPDAGFAAYVDWLRAHGDLWPAAQAGDAARFARAVKATAYTPYIDPAAVGRSLEVLSREIRAAGYLAPFAPSVVQLGAMSSLAVYGTWTAIAAGVAVVFAGTVMGRGRA